MKQVITDAVAAALLDGSPDGVVICDADGVIVLVNKQAEELFGANRADLVGKAVEHLVPDQQRAVHINHRTGYIRNPRTRAMGESLQLWAKRVDGATFPVEVALSPWTTDELHVCDRDGARRERSTRHPGRAGIGADEDDARRGP